MKHTLLLVGLCGCAAHSVPHPAAAPEPARAASCAYVADDSLAEREHVQRHEAMAMLEALLSEDDARTDVRAGTLPERP